MPISLRIFFLLLLSATGYYLGAHSQVATAHMHRSYFSDREFFDQAYAGLTNAPVQHVGAILVNHHLLARDLIAQAFRAAERTNPKVVVVISPNHFWRGNGSIIASAEDWITPYGVLRAAKSTAQAVANAGVARIDEVPFEREHGISGIVPFVHRSFPRATVLPIIIKSTATKEEMDALLSALDGLLPKDRLLVASVDMSHYMAESMALPKDEATIAALNASDTDAIWQAEIDSPATVYAIMRAMRGAGMQFQLLARDSSAFRTGSTNPDDNTSYITGYWQP